MKVFVYGTLKKGQCRAHVMNGKFLGETKTLPKYRLNHLRAFPGLTREENGKAIIGELWEIDEDCLELLDHIEGHPTFFRREEVELEHAEGADAVAYFWLGAPGEDAGDCWK